MTYLLACYEKSGKITRLHTATLQKRRDFYAGCQMLQFHWLKEKTSVIDQLWHLSSALLKSREVLVNGFEV